jgi:ATP-dependent Clp protease ATP-binding subunit ClpA
MSSPIDKLRRRVRDEVSARKHSSQEEGGGGKFDKFTERARKALSFSQEEAHRLNHDYIGTEHLLLGLIRESGGIAGRVLADLNVELEAVRHAVEQVIGRGDSPVSGAVGFTPRSKKVVELAVDDARRMGHRYIGTEHLLLGLLREGEGVGAGVLETFGLELGQVREAVVRALEVRGAAEPSPAPKNNVVTCRLDDRALDALDALVEAGIRTTRSDAAAWLIAAGIEAHRPLFDRVQATLDEIRRLRAEAREMARQIVTEGDGAAGAVAAVAPPGQANSAPQAPDTTETPPKPDA